MKNIGGFLVFIFGGFLYASQDIDIALGTRNRMELFKTAIRNLNAATNAENMCLYLMDGNEHQEVSEFMQGQQWRFKLIKIWRDGDVEVIRDNPGVWSIIYHFLFMQGKSEYMTFWSDDILIEQADALDKAVRRLEQAGDSVGASLLFARYGKDKAAVIYGNQTGIPPIWFGVMRRSVYEKVGGLEAAYRFFFSDTDLTNKFYWQEHRTFILNADCNITHFESDWKNPFAKRAQLLKDKKYYESLWRKQYCDSIRKESIAGIYPSEDAVTLSKKTFAVRLGVVPFVDAKKLVVMQNNNPVPTSQECVIARSEDVDAPRTD